MSAEKRNKDKEMAAYMKKNPGRYPDSYRKPWRGCGAGDRDNAARMGAEYRDKFTSHWQRGMMGGVLAAKLGYGSANVPEELIG